ncbi:hypothetical protein ACFXBB_23615 [Streptomyces scopuliridis]|uniref:hypothetical protein n=1 Tax=Streptomyces scopuliridis TaxID=452529 RepID=UPI0036B5243F
MVVAAVMAVAVLQWLAANWWLLIVLVVLAVGTGAVWFYLRGQRAAWDRVQAQGLRYQLTQLDALHHRGLEFAVRDLMRRDGCQDAVQVGGRGDNGADVLGEWAAGSRPLWEILNRLPPPRKASALS